MAAMAANVSLVSREVDCFSMSQAVRLQNVHFDGMPI
jgi:hypothetical protein